MLENLPTYITLVFVITTIAGVGCFYWILQNAAPKILDPKKTTIALISWLLIHAMLSYILFYVQPATAFPPRFLIVVLPVFAMIFWCFLSKKGKAIVDSLPLYQLTFFNLVRIPVELCLFWLFVNKAVPEIMTFEGRNFDIIGGLTCLFIAYFGYRQKQIGRTGLLIWNFAMLALICNIVFHGLLSGPTPIQQFGLDQPNIALIHFPFIWLPGFLAPFVLFGHLVQIRQLLRGKLVYGVEE